MATMRGKVLRWLGRRFATVDADAGSPPASSRRRPYRRGGCLRGLAGSGASAGSRPSASPPSSRGPSSSSTTQSTPAASRSTPSLPTSTSAPPSPAAEQKAAALLHAADVHDQLVFNRGVVVVLDRGQPNSFPAFSAWFQSVANGPLPRRNAGDQAANLLPDSQAVTDCQNHDLTADIDQLANDGLDVGRSSDATARQKVHADIKQFKSDFATDEHDADQVAAGKQALPRARGRRRPVSARARRRSESRSTPRPWTTTRPNPAGLPSLKRSTRGRRGPTAQFDAVLWSSKRRVAWLSSRGLVDAATVSGSVLGRSRRWRELRECSSRCAVGRFGAVVT